MSDEQTPASTPAPASEQPQTTITPLSVTSFGALSIVLFRKTVKTPQGELSGIFFNVHYNQGQDDPTAIPLNQAFSLAAVLEEIAKPAIVVRSMQPPSPAPTDNELRKLLKKSKKK